LPGKKKATVFVCTPFNLHLASQKAKYGKCNNILTCFSLLCQGKKITFKGALLFERELDDGEQSEVPSNGLLLHLDDDKGAGQSKCD
jgi:hypothetical protein